LRCIGNKKWLSLEEVFLAWNWAIFLTIVLLEVSLGCTGVEMNFRGALRDSVEKKALNWQAG